MADKTGIEWSDATWNPVVGCSIISPGCTNCYAMKLAGRLERMGSPIYKGHTQQTKAGAVWNGTVAASNWGQVIRPLSWRRPRRIFVNSMSDLFHDGLPDLIVDTVFAVMAVSAQHRFQVLTKRADRMRSYVTELGRHQDRLESAAREIGRTLKFEGKWLVDWPLPNVWLGVSVEDQERADERIPELLATPAAVRFLSCEPLLGPVDLCRIVPKGRFEVDALSGHDFDQGHTGNRIDWVIVGGESGPGARPMELAWAYSLVKQCEAAGVACFVKQLGAKPQSSGGCAGADPDGIYRYRFRDRKGGDWEEWLPELRIRQFPAERGAW